MEFAEWMRGEVNSRDWSLDQAAAATGVSRAQINRYMLGTALPGRKNINRLARYFGRTPADIMGMFPSVEPSAVAPAQLQVTAQTTTALSVATVVSRYLEESGMTTERVQSLLRRDAELALVLEEGGGDGGNPVGADQDAEARVERIALVGHVSPVRTA